MPRPIPQRVRLGRTGFLASSFQRVFSPVDWRLARQLTHPCCARREPVPHRRLTDSHPWPFLACREGCNARSGFWSRLRKELSPKTALVLPRRARLGGRASGLPHAQVVPDSVEGAHFQQVSWAPCLPNGALSEHGGGQGRVGRWGRIRAKQSGRKSEPHWSELAGTPAAALMTQSRPSPGGSARSGAASLGGGRDGTPLW